MSAIHVQVSHRAKISYLALYSIGRNFSTTRSWASPSPHHPSDSNAGPFTGTYEPGLPTSGPLGDASSFGVPRLTPKALKRYLDQFVVAQDRAKRKLCVAVYNHYQRILELQRRDGEEEELSQQQQVQRDQEQDPRRDLRPRSRLGSTLMPEYSPLIVEKSNMLLLGPSGVGKTLMAK